MIDSEDVDGIREYLLNPYKRFEICKGQVYILSSIDDLWPFLIDKHFLYIHFHYDKDMLIRNYDTMYD